MRKISTTNVELKNLIEELRELSIKEKVNIWKRVAKDLSKSRRQRRNVNLDKIDKHTKDNETIIVPGKVLGDGNLTHKVKIAAFQFSELAKNKIKNSLKIQEIMKENPKGKNIRIIG